MNIKLLNDKVLLKILEEPQTSSYIHIASNSDGKSNYGEIFAVGEKLHNKVKKGDKVYYSKYAGTEVSLKGESYICITETDILVIIEEV